MRSAAPALLPVFRSRLQADILAALLLDPDRSYSMTDLAKRFGAPLSTVHDEAQRLTEAGLLNRHDAGRSAMLQANARNRITKPLTPVTRAASAWQAAPDPLLEQIHATPYLIVLEPDDNPGGSGGATNGSARP